MLALTYAADVPIWMPILMFPIFDIGMLGYVSKNPRLGALTYNVSHNATLPTLFIIFGVLGDLKAVSVIGYAWTLHIAVDRVLGFGLKYKSSFYRTHLGEIATKGTLSLLQGSGASPATPQQQQQPLTPTTPLTAAGSLPPDAQAQQYSSYPYSRSELPAQTSGHPEVRQ